MNIQTCRHGRATDIGRLFGFVSGSKNLLPGKRILVTADLDDPVFDVHTENLLDMLSRYSVAITCFAPNKTQRGEESYPILERIGEFASARNLTVEFASHSVSHTALPKNNPRGAASIIEESLSTFQERGIPVHGFRSPFLSTEREYLTILRELSKGECLLSYDSSTLFEGNLFISHVHDVLCWKSPHSVAGIWELPISCLDDYHLFEKSGVEEHRVLAYWRRKVERSLRKYNYFLLLVHPLMTGKHLTVLESLITYCKKVYPDAGFVTCYQLVEELNAVRKKRGRE